MHISSGYDPVHDRVTPIRRSPAGPRYLPTPAAPWLIADGATHRRDPSPAELLHIRNETAALAHRLELDEIRRRHTAALEEQVIKLVGREAYYAPRKPATLDLPDPKRTLARQPAPRKPAKTNRRPTGSAYARARLAAAQAHRDALRDTVPVTASAPPPRWRKMPDGRGVYDAALMSEADARRLTYPRR